MGEDYLRKKQKIYRRSLQSAIARQLIPPPLMAPRETATTLWPCELQQPLTLRDHDKYYVHRRDKDYCEVLSANQPIGNVRVEALRDMNAYLNSRQTDVVRIRPRQVDGTHLTFTIEEEIA